MLGRAIQKAIRRSFIYEVIKPLWWQKELLDWRRRGKRGPLPRVLKQSIIKGYAQKFSVEVFIETGTYLGDMIEAVLDTFSRIISIEIDPSLAGRAKKRFSRYSHVFVLQGDSSQLLPPLLRVTTERCLFWLDAHYSSGITAKGDRETPVMRELQCILRHPAEHVILIDDARQFVGQNDYPTLEAVHGLVNDMRPGWTVEVKDDIIRIHTILEQS